MNAVTSLQDLDALPKANDVCVCSACLEIGIFIGVGYQMRKPTSAENIAFRLNADVVKHIAAAQVIAQQRRRIN